MPTKLLFFILTLILFSCNSRENETNKVSRSKENSALSPGQWLLELDLQNGHLLPVEFHLKEIDGHFKPVFINGLEKIEAAYFKITGDSIEFELPVFKGKFDGVIKDSERFSGKWTNFSKSSDYQLGFIAQKHSGTRFKVESDPNPGQMGGKWEVTFSPATEKAYKAIGQFEQKNQELQGTFITETGDYRYLAGNVKGDSLYLSCFDGAHAFLFKAALTIDTLKGMFWSGKHWKEPWCAVKNPDFELTDPDSLTYLKQGYDQLELAFPNLNGDTIRYPSERFKNKVVLVQLMASWCPNCMDETKYLTQIHQQYQSEGLEIIALAFEKPSSLQSATENVKRLKNHFHSAYHFLIATGVDSKSTAHQKVPMLNHVMSYPTLIYIDRSEKIQKIHTGFYGPGTGIPYDQFVKESNSLIEDMLAQ